MKGTPEALEKMYNRLDKFLKTETVIGERIELEGVSLIPVISASFCIGTGVGASTDADGGDSEGGGGGLGCKISPRALLVVRDDEVELISLEDKSSLDNLVEKVPELLEKLAAMKGAEGEEQSTQESKEEGDLSADNLEGNDI